jgi:hypothetical protein
MTVLGMMVIIGAVVYRMVDKPTLSEQAEMLHDVRPNDMGQRLQLSDWSRQGTVLLATYESRRGVLNELTLSLWPDATQAERWFTQTVGRFRQQQIVQEINTFDGEESCVAVEATTRCVGYDGTRSFDGRTDGSSFTRQLDALLLIRIARKHWYRVFR